MTRDIVVCSIMIIMLVVFATLLRFGKGTSLIAGIKSVPEKERKKVGKGFSVVLYLIALDVVFFMVSLILDSMMLQKISSALIMVIVIGAVVVGNFPKGKNNE